MVKPQADSTVSTEEQPLKQGVEETIEDPKDEGVSDEDFVPKVDEEGEEDGEPSSTEEDDAAPEEDDGLEELSLDDFEEPEEKKSGVQKRIDKLVAGKKASDERTRVLEEKLSRLEQGKQGDVPEYSEAQLRAALDKAVEQGDSNLMWEIQDYREKRFEKRMEEKYLKYHQGPIEAQKRQNQEWSTIVEEYSYLSDSEEPELFKGSHRDLNVKDTNSTVYKLASKLYLDPERVERYQKDGGQRLAVSDAVRMILRKKNAKVQSKETKILKRQLVKEKQKSSVSSGKAVKADSSKPISHKTSLEEYMAERKKHKATLAGGI